MELRIKASEEGYEQIAELARLIAIAKNPQYWFNGVNNSDLANDEPKRLAIIATLESHMAELIS